MSVGRALAVEVGPGGLNFTPFSRLVCRQPDYEVHFVQLNIIIAHTQLPLRLAVAAFLRAPLDDGTCPPIAEMVGGVLLTRASSFEDPHDDIRVVSSVIHIAPVSLCSGK